MAHRLRRYRDLSAGHVVNAGANLRVGAADVKQRRRSPSAPSAPSAPPTLASLLAYGQRYRYRYQPSIAKLQQQLATRSDDAELVAEALAALTPAMDDLARARELAQLLQAQGRHARWIAGQLRQKQFPAEIIARCLAELVGADGSTLDAVAVGRRVAQLRRKGLSARAIGQKLGAGAQDAPVISAALDAQGDGDAEAIRRLLHKLRNKGLDEAAVIRRLAGRGFRYGDIRRVLDAERDLT